MESEKRLSEIRTLREKMKAVAGEARTKDDMYKQLVSEISPQFRKLIPM